MFSTKSLIRMIRFQAMITILMAGFSFTVHAANIIAFGDSLTLGLGSASGGYPGHLEAILDSSGRPSTVINAASDGESTAGGVGRIDATLGSVRTNFVLIMEGTNDCFGGISAQTGQFNLQAMISSAKRAGVVPLISTIPPVNYPAVNDIIGNAWNPMIYQLAANNGIALVDNFASLLPYVGGFSDGVHPDDGGYHLMALNWYAPLSGMITPSQAPPSTPVEATAPATATETTEPAIEQNTGGGGGGGGCFIATAAFGSPFAQHVLLLKEFRDTILLSTKAGKKFVAAYYHYSPPVAAFIERHEQIKPLVRFLLSPLVGMAYLLLHTSPILLLCMASATGMLLLTFAMRKMSRRHAGV